MKTTSRRRRHALAALALGLSCAASLPAFALNRWVEIINYTDYTLVEFHATNEGNSLWGRDWLGWEVIPPGHSIHRNIDDGSGYCLYDFKAVFEDGEELMDYGINVCEILDFTYH